MMTLKDLEQKLKLARERGADDNTLIGISETFSAVTNGLKGWLSSDNGLIVIYASRDTDNHEPPGLL